MNLDELRTEYELPEEVIRFCRGHGLLNLDLIQTHEVLKGGFGELEGCNEHIEKTLLNLLTVVRLLDQKEIGDLLPPPSTLSPYAPTRSRTNSEKESTPPALSSVQPGYADPSLSQLAVLFGLSVRAFNVCQAHDLLCLSSIAKFQLEQNSFAKLRNCGSKTQMELSDLLSKARAAGYLTTGTVEVEMRVDEEALQRIFMTQYVRLSQRARNVLSRHIERPEAELALRLFMQMGRRMPKLPGAAGVVMAELRAFRDALVNGTSTHAVVGNAAPPSSTPPTALELWCKLNTVQNEIPFLQDVDGTLTMFRFLQQAFAKADMGTADRVFLRYLSRSGQEKPLQDIASDVGLSRERVRQLLLKLGDSYPDRLAFIHDLPGVRDRYPELMSHGAVLVLSDDIRDRLNEREGTDWSSLFFAMCAQVLNGLEYDQGDWTGFGLSQGRAKELQLGRPFIIRSKEVPDLQHVMHDLVTRVEEPRTASESLDMYGFVADKAVMHRDDLVHATTTLIRCAFPDIDQQGAHLVLPSNKRRNQEDILKEILLELNEPSHASVIVERWNGRIPERPVTIEVVRAVAIRNKELFFSISRTSTYGLRQWELERPALKGGTLRDIVETELERSYRPLHISELTLAVGRFRDRPSTSSIRTNLNLDASGRFVALPDGFFGLANRQYGVMRSDLRNVPSSLLRTVFLSKFVGRSMTDLTEHLVTLGRVHGDIVVATLQLLVNEGRIILDGKGNIVHVTSEPVELGNPGTENDELPFPVG